MGDVLGIDQEEEYGVCGICLLRIPFADAERHMREVHNETLEVRTVQVYECGTCGADLTHGPCGCR